MAGENEDGGIRELLGYIRADIATQFANVNARLDKFATNDSLDAATRRFDEKLADLGSDLQAEIREREKGETNLSTSFAIQVADVVKRITTNEDRTTAVADEQAKRRSAWKQGLTIGGFTVLLGGLVSVAVLLIQSAAHLGS